LGVLGIAGIIGAKNPWASRLVRLIAADLFRGFAIAKEQGMSSEAGTLVRPAEP
jgi:hypothetical protein